MVGRRCEDEVKVWLRKSKKCWEPEGVSRGGPHSPSCHDWLQAQVHKESELFNPGAISPQGSALDCGPELGDSHGISNSGLNHCQQSGSGEIEGG